MDKQTTSVGEMLREWRQRRRMSQLAFACDAESSARHLSFLETGRSRPSRQMLLHLSELLEIPFRERNALLIASGFAPIFSETRLDSPDAAAVRRAIDLMLAAHEPFPALAVDRHWNLVAANTGIPLLLTGVADKLLEAPVNVLRLSLHPKGLAPRIENLGEWRAHIFARLQQQMDITNDEGLVALASELEAYPGGKKPVESYDAKFGGLIVPLKFRNGAGTLSFFSATTVFTTAVDITFSELIIETFMPADEFTASVIRQLAESM